MSISVKGEEQLFGSAEISVEGIRVMYRLYRREGAGRDIYSIEVITERGGVWDREYADSVTTLTDEAEKIFALLIEGEVTSCTLCDVLEDML